MVGEADLVVTAEAAQRRFILDERPEAFRRVVSFGQLAHILDAAEPATLDAGADGLLALLRSGFRPAEEADDVVDPYGRGDAAAARAAEHLDELVSRLVAVLAADPRLVPGAGVPRA